MFEARRQHPVAALTTALQIIKENFITLLVVLFVTSGGSQSMVSLFGILSVFTVLLIGGVLSWLRFTYRVVDGELRIEQGVFVRKNIYLSRERIQSIDIKAGVVQRLFGLVEVEVKTAGSSSREAKISAVTREKAEELKRELRNNDGEQQRAEKSEEAVPPEPDIYGITTRELIIAACTSGSFGIALSIVGTVFSQVDQVISEEQMVRYLETLVPASLSTFMVIYMVIFLVVFSWILSFLGTVIKYFGFSLEVYEQELVIRQGLFERRQLTIPFNRIQAVQIKEGIMRQPFGLASLVLESAGYGEKGQQGNSATLYPLIRREDAYDFLERTVPGYGRGRFSDRPPLRALRRYLSRMLVASLLLVVPVWWLLDIGWYALLLLVPGLLLGYLQYRAARIGVQGETLMIQSRKIGKKTAIVHKKRIQSAALVQNPLQKRSDLMNYQLSVASGSGGAEFKIRELDEAMAGEYLRWVSATAGRTQSTPPEKPISSPDID